MSLKKLLNSLTIPSNTAPNATGSPRQRSASEGLSQRPKGAPPDLGMDDLLSLHLAQRSERMFNAEFSETNEIIQTRRSDSVPNPEPETMIDFVPPPPRPRRSRHHSSRDQGHSSSRRPGDPHLHPRANQQLLSDPLQEMARTDRGVRTQALADISSIMTNTSSSAKDAALALRRVRDRCRTAGVPFGQLLDEEIEGFGMIPLIVEIIRCDFTDAPDLLLFLLEHSQSKNLQLDVRRGCMLRSDSANLYETLRHFIPSPSVHSWDPPRFEYEISIQQEVPTDITRHSYLNPSSSHVPLTPPMSDAAYSTSTNEFHALISIPNFPHALMHDAVALAKRRAAPPEKRGEQWGADVDTLLRAEAGLVVEWIACNRAWTLEIGSNRLQLTLLDGEPCSIDAKMTVVKEDRPLLSKLDIKPLPDLRTAQRPPTHLTPSVGGAGPSSSGRPVRPKVDTHDSAPLLFSVEPPTPQRNRGGPAESSPVFYTEPQSALVPNPRLSGTVPARPPRAARPLVFPPATLHPLRERGQHKLILAPCFPPYAVTTSFIKSVLSSKELLVELVVRLGPPTPSEGTGLGERRASVGGRSFVREAVRGEVIPPGFTASPSPSGCSSLFEDDDEFGQTAGAGPSTNHWDPIRSKSYGL